MLIADFLECGTTCKLGQKLAKFKILKKKQKAEQNICSQTTSENS